MYTIEQVITMNRTSRSNGAVGARAIVPRIVEGLITRYDFVLDYGAGKKAIHVKNLKQKGYSVVAAEIGSNAVPGIHNYLWYQGAYDLVYASNVLNVQENLQGIRKVLEDCYRVLKEGGLFVCNYPNSPRKAPRFKNHHIEDLILNFFGNSTKIQSGIWQAEKVT